jgi:FtsZ-interacting cell division protein ZipA
MEQKSSIGSIIGTVIIIAIIILGGLYFWGKRIEDAKMKQNLVSDNTNLSTENEASALKSTTTKDDLTSIEADLNSTNLNNLDAELNAQ